MCWCVVFGVSWTAHSSFFPYNIYIILILHQWMQKCIHGCIILPSVDEVSNTWCDVIWVVDTIYTDKATVHSIGSDGFCLVENILKNIGWSFYLYMASYSAVQSSLKASSVVIFSENSVLNFSKDAFNQFSDNRNHYGSMNVFSEMRRYTQSIYWFSVSNCNAQWTLTGMFDSLQYWLLWKKRGKSLRYLLWLVYSIA